MGKRKARRKRLQKALRMHGADILIGLVTGLVTNLATDRMAPDQRRPKRQAQ